MGLARAVEQFNACRVYALRTYASQWIRQAVQRAGHDVGIIHLPTVIASVATRWLQKVNSAVSSPACGTALKRPCGFGVLCHWIKRSLAATAMALRWLRCCQPQREPPGCPGVATGCRSIALTRLRGDCAAETSTDVGHQGTSQVSCASPSSHEEPDCAIQGSLAGHPHSDAYVPTQPSLSPVGDSEIRAGLSSNTAHGFHSGP